MMTRLCQAADGAREQQDLDIVLKTALGSAMFGSAAESQQVQSFAKKLVDKLKAFSTAEVITEEMLVAYDTETVELIAAQSAGSTTSTADPRHKREIEIVYFQKTFKLWVPLASLILTMTISILFVLNLFSLFYSAF